MLGQELATRRALFSTCAVWRFGEVPNFRPSAFLHEERRLSGILPEEKHWRSRGTAERPSAPKQKAPQPPPKEAKRGKGPGDDQRKIISAWSDDNARKSAAGLPGPVALRAQLERVRQEQLRSEVGQAEPQDGGALELEGGTGVFPALDGLSTSTKFTSSCWSERCSSGRGGAKRRYYDTLDDFEQGEREGGPLVRPTRLEGEPLAEGSDQRQEQRKRRSQEGDRPREVKGRVHEPSSLKWWQALLNLAGDFSGLGVGLCFCLFERGETLDAELLRQLSAEMALKKVSQHPRVKRSKNNVFPLPQFWSLNFSEFDSCAGLEEVLNNKPFVALLHVLRSLAGAPWPPSFVMTWLMKVSNLVQVNLWPRSAIC